MADYKVITSDFVNVQISTSKNDISFNEKRFAKDVTVSELKGKLELMTGGSCSTMKIEIFNKDNDLVCSLNDDNALLGSYPVENGMRMNVVDNFAIRSELDFGNAPKYEISKEEYNKRDDTVRAFLLKNKLGQYNEEDIKKKEKLEEEEQKLAESAVIGSRCKVTVPKAATKLGTVMYSGKVEGLNGFWVGVKYDEPLGKNNGTFNDKKYFECPPNYGAFVKPQNILCGDFPEATYDLDDEI